MNDYLRKYEFFFKKFKDEEFTLLELGVYKGASLCTWGGYFCNARVIGVDINKSCEQYKGDNREVIITDLGNKDSLKELASLTPKIIIDDASHLWSHQIIALCSLFPSLQSGGIYVVEDITTSFPSFRFMQYDDAVISAYDFLSAISEVVTGSQYLRLKDRQEVWKEIHNDVEQIGRSVAMISFLYGSCIIIKK